MPIPNDQPEPRTADTNPWYVLMTLHGDRHEDNRRAWNAWAGQALTHDQKQTAAAQAQVTLQELYAWETLESQVKQAFNAEWSTRNPGVRRPRFPDPRDEIRFSRTTFARFNAEGMVFIRSSFDDARFGTRPNFTRASFCQGASFASAEFAEGACFDHATFQSRASFRHAKFAAAVSFTGTQFASTVSSVNFGQAVFGRPIDPSPHDTSKFARAAFNSFTLFNDARFHHNVEFRQTVFNANVTFAAAHFFNGARFHDSTFRRSAAFDATTFCDVPEFLRSRFVGYARFNAACFSRGCWFADGTFDASVSFAKAKFGDRATFGSLAFNGRASFEEAAFGKSDVLPPCEPDFTSSAFNEPVSFRGARFAMHYPVLSGTLLHERSTFSDDDDLWPALGGPGERKAGRLKGGTALRLAKDSCAVIRHCLANQGLPEAAHFFFRREMRFAMRDAPLHRKAPYWLYWSLSNFGHSIVRPAIGLLFVFCASWMALCLWSPTTGDDCCPEPWKHALLNTVGPFASLRQHYPGCHEPGLEPLLGMVQTVVSFALLFLLGLGLRQRFRLR